MKNDRTKATRLEKARMFANRLHAKIVGQRLIVSIGIDTLAFAAEECDGNPKVKILDPKTLAKDVISELQKDDEVGASMLTDLFDKAVNLAMENGSIAFAEIDNCHSCGQTITKGATECPHCLATDVED
jgi:hypothetical protein